jgi:acyl carrier protein
MSSDKHHAIKFLSEVFGVDDSKIPEDASLENYSKWDSLGHMRIILHLETVLGRSIEIEEVLSITDLGGIQKLLEVG